MTTLVALSRSARAVPVSLSQIRSYRRPERHSSLLPKTWVLSSSDPMDNLRTTRLAQALGIPYEIQKVKQSWLSLAAYRQLINLRSIFQSQKSGSLHYKDSDIDNGLPRLAIASSEETLPALLEIKQQSQDRVTAVFLGLPSTKLSTIDVLVLSRLDQMRLRSLGPARANLENSISTLLPLSGATQTKPHVLSANGKREIAVCIGSGIESAGFQLLSDDIDMLANGLLQVARSDPVLLLLSNRMHKSVRSMVETRLINKLAASFVDSQGSKHDAVNLQVIDYAKPDQPSPETVLASATHIVATADNIPSVSLGVSLGKPVYISGEERTLRILRNYYRILDTENLVRRFYPKGSRYSYMLAADIAGPIDEFSAIRDHEPWAMYNSQDDIDSVAAFIHERYSLLHS
ncbi:hypothetical protein J3B02_001285 [Coemansia erecta]|uniref:Uncharacterized protein n=1 Tax=Coemansia asiatica TaxID=1052880 RepID=A0A9W8CNB9_9FUNG|nr:hypothetical protein LPJ64_000171 [Coemansia asiatica]KAJ2857001.1 hypothetical protein J3B02_001285 [Coemansia erecta]KAJ2888143.1 hypothetical protein FB639_000841 [Coemansia asiatica]